MKPALDALWASITRTIVPLIVGGVLGWLASTSIPIDGEFETTLTAVLTVACSGVYYVIVRLFETYVSPKLGWLIGLGKSPDTYSADAPTE